MLPSATMSTALPDSLADGRFKLLEVIGEGGMATVYRAYDQRLQRPRAIKVLSPALANRPSLRRRFLAEAQTMATLEESRVVRIFDMGEDADRVFIVMELVEGGSLLDRLRRAGPLPPRLAAEVALQICESLQAAHDAGVIHRDIKPHNILLTRSGEIRITDFGIAQVQNEGDDGLTKTGAVMGTWGFMAPEQKSNAKTVDARADIYSVGATLWALLRNDSPPELFMAEEEPSMVEGIVEPLAEVIKRATRYRREERYPTVRAMAESVRALVDLLPEDPPETPPLALPRSDEPQPRLDTLAQFSEPPAAVAGTMVPDPEPEPAPAPPPAAVAASPAGHAETLVLESSDATPAPPRARGPLLGGLVGAVTLVGVVGWMLLGGDERSSPAAGEPAVAGTSPPPPEARPAVEPDPVPVPAGDPATPPSTDSPGTSPPVAVAAEPSPPVDKPSPGSPNEAPATPSTGSPASRPTEARTATPAEAAPAVAELAPAEAVAKPREVAATAEPPKPITLDHRPPVGATAGDVVSFTATGPGSGWTVTLYYKVSGTSAFQERAMRQAGGTWTVSLKTDPTWAGLSYFIKAESGSATLFAGKPTSPLTLNLTAPATDASPTPQ